MSNILGSALLRSYWTEVGVRSLEAPSRDTRPNYAAEKEAKNTKPQKVSAKDANLCTCAKHAWGLASQGLSCCPANLVEASPHMSEHHIFGGNRSHNERESTNPRNPN